MKQRWEYTCCSIAESGLNYEDLLKHLNKMGGDGWELVGISNPLATIKGGGFSKRAVRNVNNQLTYWLKRPLD